MVYSCDDNRADQQQPISEWNVHMAMKYLRRVDQFDLREVRQLHDLREKLESTSDHSLLDG